MSISGHSLARTQGMEEMSRPEVNMEMRRMMIMTQSERGSGRMVVKRTKEIRKQQIATTEDDMRRELRLPYICTKIMEKTIPIVLRRATKMESSSGCEKPMELTRSIAKNAIENPPLSGVIMRRRGGMNIVTLEMFLNFILMLEVFLLVLSTSEPC